MSNEELENRCPKVLLQQEVLDPAGGLFRLVNPQYTLEAASNDLEPQLRIVINIRNDH